MIFKIKIKNETIKYLGLSVFSGVLLSFAYVPPNLDFLPWVAFLPLFFAIDGLKPKKAFLFSYLSGVVFFLITIFWLTNVTLIGWIILCLYLGLYFAFFGLFARLALKVYKSYQLLFILPSLWVSLEFVRGILFSGFGWNGLGYSQFNNLSLIQIADFSGVYGVSFLIIFVNCVFWLILRRRTDRLILALILCFVLLLVLAYGIMRLNQDFADKEKNFKVSIIQPDIPQDLKWDPVAKEYILETLSDLSIRAAQDKPDMIIWPESAVPDFLTDYPGDFDAVPQLARELDSSLLTGVVKYSRGNFYNSALLISPAGDIVKEYDKLHLVPYGEFIPFRRFTPYLAAVVGIGDFTPGKDYSVFSLDNKDKKLPALKFSVLICFEDAFGDLSRGFIKNGAQALVNITNDAWFGRGSQRQQHLSASVLRAVENRISVIRCANTGISGLINDKGRRSILQYTCGAGDNVNAGNFKVFNIQPKNKNFSFYSLYGDLFAYACLAIAFLGLGIVFIKRRGRK